MASLLRPWLLVFAALGLGWSSLAGAWGVISSQGSTTNLTNVVAITGWVQTTGLSGVQYRNTPDTITWSEGSHKAGTCAANGVYIGYAIATGGTRKPGWVRDTQGLYEGSSDNYFTGTPSAYYCLVEHDGSDPNGNIAVHAWATVQLPPYLVGPAEAPTISGSTGANCDVNLSWNQTVNTDSYYLGYAPPGAWQGTSWGWVGGGPTANVKATDFPGYTCGSQIQFMMTSYYSVTGVWAPNWSNWITVTFGPQAPNNATFTSSGLPGYMVAGSTATGNYLSFQNTGGPSWTYPNYKVGAINPVDNTTWGTNRLSIIPSGTTIATNGSYSFPVTLIAPTTPGVYALQGQMLQEGVGYFGGASTSFNIPVVPLQPTGFSTTRNQLDHVDLTWTASASPSTAYQIERCLTSNDSTCSSAATVIANTAVGATSYVDSTGTTAQHYLYTIKAYHATAGVNPVDPLSSMGYSVGDNSTFVSQSVPTTMFAGQTYSVSQTWTNTGTSTWTGSSVTGSCAATAVATGAISPTDNSTWGISAMYGSPQDRYPLLATDSIGPGQSVTTTYNVKAPSTPGTYTFQRQTVRDCVHWFGAASTAVSVTVIGPPSAPASLSVTQGTITNGVNMTWSAGSGATSYNVYWQPNGSWVLIGNTTSTSYSFNPSAYGGAKSAGNYGTYTFGINSVNAAGEVGTTSATGYANGAPTGAALTITANSNASASAGPPTVTDPNSGQGEAYTYALFTNVPAGKGSVSLAGSSFTWTPPADQSASGVLNFTYRVTDKAGATYDATGTVNVTGIDNASYVSNTVPTAMVAGNSYTVTVTMQNNGATTWSGQASASNYKLGSGSPTDNTTWGTHRYAEVPLGTNIAPGQQYSFGFNITAPATAGTYIFSAGMLKEGSWWFGPHVPDISVTVTSIPTSHVSSVQATDGTLTGKVRVTWSETASGTVTYYQLRKLPPPYSAWQNLATVAKGTATYDDTTAAPSGGTNFYYDVLACNTVGCVVDGGPLGASPRDTGYPNLAPTATSASITTDAVTASLGVTPNVTDPNEAAGQGENYAFAILTQPSAGQGTASVVANKLVYTPPVSGAFAGATSFTYRVTDKAGANFDGTATVTVTAVTPSVPTGVAATDGTLTGKVRITWTTAGNAVSYNISTAPSAGGAKTQIASGVTGTTYDYTVAGVTPLFYSVQAVSASGGVSAASTENSGYPNAAPTATSAALTATASAASAATAPGTTDANVAAGQTDPITYAVVAQPAAGQGTASVSSNKLVWTPPGAYNYAGTTTFTFSATDSVGASVTGTATVTVSAVAAGIPTGVAATQGTITDTVRVSWTAVAGASSYNVYRAGAKVNGSAITGTSFDDPNTTVTAVGYTVRSMSPSGMESADSTIASGYPNKPPTATSASLTAMSNATSAGVTPAVTDPNTAAGQSESYTFAIAGQPAAGQGTASVVANQLVWTPPASYNFAGTTSFSYSVTDKGGVSVTGTATVTVNVVVPAAPTSVGATDGTRTGSVRVTWTASANASSYNISTAPSAGGAKTQVASGVTGTTYDYAVADVTKLYYSVQAVSASGGASAFSAEDAGYPNAAPTGTSATLTATASAASVATAPVTTDPNVVAGQTDAITYAIVTQPPGGQGTASVSVGKLIWSPPAAFNYAGTTTFTYSATDSVGAVITGTASVTVTAVAVAIPTGITATQGTVTDAVRVGWTAVSGAASYNVYRDGGQVGSAVTGTSYNHAMANTTAGSYTVRSMSPSNVESADSASVSGYANRAPTATSASLTATANSASAAVSPTVTDPNTAAGQTESFTVAIVAQPSAGQGTASVVSNQLLWTPPASYNFAGITSFSYAVTDKGGATVNGTATVTVNAVVPGVPGSVAATDGTRTGSVRVTWSSGSNATSYNLSTALSAGGAKTQIATGVTGTTYDYPVTDVTKLYYSVQAVSASGGSSAYSTEDAGYPNAVPTVTSATLTATAAAASGATAPVTTDPNLAAGQPDTITYAIVTQPAAGEGTATQSAGKLIWSPPGAHNFAGVTTFTFSATDAAGAAVNGTATVTVAAVPVAVPSGITATQGTITDVVRVTWNAVSEAMGYNVYRDGAKVGSAVIGTSYDHAMVTAAAGSYTVRSISPSNVESADSASVSGYANRTPTVTTASLTATANSAATSVTPGVTDPNVAAGQAESFTFAIVAQPPAGQGVASVVSNKLLWTPPAAYNFAGITSFTYSVTDKGGASITGTATVTVAAVIPAVVTGVAATDGSRTDSVRVTWTTANNAVSYNISTATSAGAAKTQIATGLTGNTYDYAVTDVTKLYYSVQSVSVSGGMALYSTEDTGYPNSAPTTTATALTATASAASVATAPVTVDANIVAGQSDTITYAVLAQPPGGEGVASLTAGKFIWTPPAAHNFAGVTTFAYSATDSAGAVVNGTATVTVVPAPVAIPTGITATQGTITDMVRVTWGAVVEAVGYNVYRDGVKVTGVTGTSYDHALTVAPAGNYTVRSVSPSNAESADSTGASGYANRAPTATSASLSTTANTISPPVTPAVTDANVAAGQSETFTLAILTQPPAGQGSASVVSNQLVWTPPASFNYAGTTSFTYSVTDKGGATVSGTATVTVIVVIPGVPTAVAATDGSLTGKVRISWTASANAVSYNVATAATAGGAKTEISNGVTGTSYDYTVTDVTKLYYVVQAVSASGGISAFSPEDPGYPNAAPTAASATISAIANVPSVGLTPEVTDPNLTAGQTDPLIFTIVAQPPVGQGTASVVANKLVWTPPASLAYTGTTTFSFLATDSAGANVTGIATVTVAPYVPPAPANLTATQGTITETVRTTWDSVEQAVGYNVYAAGLLVATVTTGTTTDVLVTQVNAVPYTVRAFSISGGESVDSTDASGWPNLPPMATSAILSTMALDPSTPVTPSVTDPNATAGQAESFTFAVATQPTSGSASVVANKLIWSPPADGSFAGTTTFHYTVTDRGGATLDGTATVNVTPYIPPAPTGLAATRGTITGTVQLTWPNAPGSATYRLFRSGALIAGPVTSPYDDPQATVDAQSYTVRGVSLSGGESADSTGATGWANQPPTGATVSGTVPGNASGYPLNIAILDPNVSAGQAESFTFLPATGTSAQGGSFTFKDGKLLYTAPPAGSEGGADTLNFTVTDKGGSAVAGTGTLTWCAAPKLGDGAATISHVTAAVTDDACNGNVSAKGIIQYRATTTADWETVGSFTQPLAFNGVNANYGVSRAANAKAGWYQTVVTLTDAAGQANSATYPFNVACPAPISGMAQITGTVDDATFIALGSYTSPDVCGDPLTATLQVFAADDLAGTNLLATGTLVSGALAAGTSGNLTWNFMGLQPGNYRAVQTVLNGVNANNSDPLVANDTKLFSVECAAPILYSVGISQESGLSAASGLVLMGDCNSPYTATATVTRNGDVTTLPLSLYDIIAGRTYYQFDYPITGIANGIYSLDIVVADQAGHNTTKTVALTIDRGSPTVQLTVNGVAKGGGEGSAESLGLFGVKSGNGSLPAATKQ